MKQVFILSMIAAGMLLFASCGQKEDAVIEITSITITPSMLTLTVGDKQMLTAAVEQRTLIYMLCNAQKQAVRL